MKQKRKNSHKVKKDKREINVSTSLLMNQLLNNDLKEKLLEMGNSEVAIYNFQKKRLYLSILSVLSALVLIMIHQQFVGLGAIVLAVFMWFQQERKVKKMYQFFQFKKQLNFSKFMRLMIPYLLQENDSLYSIFNRMYTRIEDQYIKKNLETLMVEMNEYPGVIAPYEQFAQRCSSSETAVLFMTTLFDFQQSSFDSSVIKELGQIASEELFTSIDDIAALKLKRFGMFPTKMTMGSFLITMGFIIGLIIDLITQMKF